MFCPLCESQSAKYILNYYKCPTCDLRFLDPDKFLSPEDEKKRYLTHNNDVNDTRYQNFVSPLVKEVCELVLKQKRGLDFGAGTGPVLAKLLSEQEYFMTIYDPFFHPNKSALDAQYDFIVSSEVVEHFYSPKTEFQLLKSLVAENGLLAIMTEIYQEHIDFESWYYRRDPTHVVFYSEKTLHWIARSFGFKSVDIKLPRVAVFRA